MAGDAVSREDFISDPWVRRYLPITNRDENGRTYAPQAEEERANTDETIEGFKTWVAFTGRPDQQLAAAFRETKGER